MVDDASEGERAMVDDASIASDDPSGAAADVAATQAAQSRADELGVDLTQVAGSGKDGRVTVADVEAHAEAAG